MLICGLIPGSCLDLASPTRFMNVRAVTLSLSKHLAYLAGLYRSSKGSLLAGTMCRLSKSLQQMVPAAMHPVQQRHQINFKQMSHSLHKPSRVEWDKAWTHLKEATVFEPDSNAIIFACLLHLLDLFRVHAEDPPHQCSKDLFALQY